MCPLCGLLSTPGLLPAGVLGPELQSHLYFRVRAFVLFSVHILLILMDFSIFISMTVFITILCPPPQTHRLYAFFFFSQKLSKIGVEIFVFVFSFPALVAIFCPRQYS